jgi:hypothetical protein
MSEWRRACEGATCIEVLILRTKVKIRDSKNPEGPWLSFSKEEFDNFKEGIIRGAFD